MIVTLTANPSTDRTVTLGGALRRGAVQRADSVISQAGGKGVNISRAAVSAGIETVAVLPVAAEDPFVLALRSADIPTETIASTGSPRVNLTISEPDGTTTKLNSPGPELAATTRDQLAEALVRLAATSPWVVLAGSLPPGTPVGWYAELIAALEPTPARVAVDTSDAPLRALVEGFSLGGRPDLMKPNGEELASLTGGDAAAIERDPHVAAEAASHLVDGGVEAVLVTLGAGGGVLVTAEGAWHATPPPIEVVSTVGAGDCSLFGYLRAHLGDAGPAERLAMAVAYGSAAAALPGTTIPQPAHVDPARVSASLLHRALPGARA